MAGYSCQREWGRWRRWRRPSLCRSLLLEMQCHHTSPCSSPLLSGSTDRQQGKGWKNTTIQEFIGIYSEKHTGKWKIHFMSFFTSNCIFCARNSLGCQNTRVSSIITVVSFSPTAWIETRSFWDGDKKVYSCLESTTMEIKLAQCVSDTKNYITLSTKTIIWNGGGQYGCLVTNKKPQENQRKKAHCT